MKYTTLLITGLLAGVLFPGTIPATLYAQDNPEALALLEKVDNNLASGSRIFESSMTIHGRRSDRTLTSKSWSKGEDSALTEYLSPASEAGTKMLKLGDNLWIYTPAADRTIQISGHMLRQSVMGSDLSYEDFMDDRKLTELYHAGTLVQDRWFPKRMVYKDMLKTGGGTEFRIDSIIFDADIPAYLLSKAGLR